jgi:hypothetical protein
MMQTMMMNNADADDANVYVIDNEGDEHDYKMIMMMTTTMRI